MSSGGGVPAVPRVLPVPSAMAKREKLEKIWQREAAKDDIIGKLRDRLSSGDQPRIGTANISREVDRFMGDKATVTEANLARLERRLQRQAKGLGSEADSEAVSISEYTTGSAALSLGSRASQQRRQPLSARQPGAMVTFREHPASICPTTSVSARGPPRGLGARGPAAAAAARQQGTPCTPSHGSRGIVGTAAPGAPGTPLGATPGLSPGAPPRPLAGQLEAHPIEWSVLDKLAAQQLEEDSIKQKEREQELQKRLRRDLDRQVADRELLKERSKQEAHKFHQTQVEAYQRHLEAEQQKEALRQQKLMVVKHERAAQVELNNARMQQEKLQEMEEGLALKAAAVQQADLDQKKKQDALGKQKEQVLKALVDGTTTARRKEEETKRLKEMEDKRVEQYRRQQEERERTMKEARLKKEEKSSNAENKFATRLSSDQKQSDCRENKALADGLEKDKRAAELEKANKAKLEELRKKNQEYLFQQMRDKQDTKSKEQERIKALRASLETDTKQFAEDEQRRQANKERRNKEHRAVLEQQIARRTRQDPSREVMSESEMRLNKSLLERIGGKQLALTDLPAGPASSV